LKKGGNRKVQIWREREKKGVGMNARRVHRKVKNKADNKHLGEEGKFLRGTKPKKREAGGHINGCPKRKVAGEGPRGGTPGGVNYLTVKGTPKGKNCTV